MTQLYTGNHLKRLQLTIFLHFLDSVFTFELIFTPLVITPRGAKATLPAWSGIGGWGRGIYAKLMEEPVVAVFGLALRCLLGCILVQP